jgi:hypothetical protein
MTIRHIVMWKLAAEDAQTRSEQAKEISRLLHKLTGVIPDILALEVGINALNPEANFDVVLTADYLDEAGLQRYNDHPEHRKVAEYIHSVISDRAAVDFRVAKPL